MRTGLNAKLNAVMDEFMRDKEPDYRSRIFLWNEKLPVRDFCGDYGWTTRQMNRWLQNHGIQYRVDGEWIPKPILERKGYVICGMEEFRGRTGIIYPSPLNYWTPAGRAFLYDFLKAYGVVPLEERKDTDDSKHKKTGKSRAEKESAYA